MKQLILLHGALGAETQLGELHALLSSDFELYCFDFNGHGIKSTDTNPFTMQQLAMELSAFIAQHQLQQPAIFGYSMGGYVALTLAAAQPGSIGAIVTLGTKFNWSVEAAQQEGKFLNPEKTMEKVPAFAAYLNKLHGEYWPALMRNTASMMLELGANHLQPTDFGRIANRVLLLLGDADNMVTMDETVAVQKYLPDAIVEVLHATPHPLEKVDAVALAKRITAFI